MGVRETRDGIGDRFPTTTEGVVEASSPELVELHGAVDWRFRVGDQLKIRLANELDSDHPMPHPFHIRGAGRFLILPERGHRAEPRLEGHGSRPDLLEVTNPGVWMAHCHIAEHNEGGMTFTFVVDERPSR